METGQFMPGTAAQARASSGAISFCVPMSASTALVWKSVQAAALHEEPLLSQTMIAGGAALAFENPAYTPSDVDVFVFGPGAAAIALQIVKNVVGAAGDGNVVVGARNSVITIWRPEQLPLQIVVSTAASKADVIGSFDISVSKISVQFSTSGVPSITLWEGGCGYGPGAFLRVGKRSDWARTRRRIVKFVMAGYALDDSNPYRSITAVDSRERASAVRVSARTPTWYGGMSKEAMAAHAMFLGGLEHVWHPDCPQRDAAVALEHLFGAAKVGACAFDGSECEYTHAHSLLSPATMMPPFKLAAITGDVAAHIAAASEALNKLIPTRSATTVGEVFKCQSSHCVFGAAAAAAVVFDDDYNDSV